MKYIVNRFVTTHKLRPALHFRPVTCLTTLPYFIKHRSANSCHKVNYSISEGKSNVTDYLQLTKTWFKAAFGRDLQDNIWNDIPFEDLLKKRVSFIRTIIVRLDREFSGDDIEPPNIDEQIEALFASFESAEHKPQLEKLSRNEGTTIDYLQITKPWFKKAFGRDLQDNYWNNIPFDDLLKEGKKSFSAAILYTLAFELGMSGRANYPTIHEHIECLYASFDGIAHKQEQEFLSNYEDENEDLRRAFGEAYKGRALEYFEDHINDCYRKWVGSNLWHSPYTSVVQSSGYGKSRLCKEFALTNRDWLTVYVCLRTSENKAYPPRHTNATDFLQSIARHGESLESRIASLEKWIDAWRWVRMLFLLFFVRMDQPHSELALNELEKFIIDLQKRDKKQNDISFDIMKNEIQKTIDKMQDEQRKLNELKAFWDITEKVATAKQLHICVQKFCELSCTVSPPTLKLLLELDEARFLIHTNVPKIAGYNLFRLFRAALKKKEEGTFAVLVDTTSRLSNFAPSFSRDPSTRSEETDASTFSIKLLPPFHWVTTTDVVTDSSQDGFPFTLGRPLWHTAFASHEYNTLEKLRKFAWDKLSYYDTEEKADMAIALIAVLTGISVSPHSSLAMELVGSHMATCCAIDDDREALYITYPVEPILSEAALYRLGTLCQYGKLRENILDPLISQLRIGIVNTGHSGELVVKLLFLLARRLSSQAFGESDLKILLQTMLGEVPDQAIHGKVSYTCFTKLNRWDKSFDDFWSYSDPQSVLKTFYDRRAAIEFPDNQPGADLLIPVKIDDISYKYLLIQVKNVVQRTKPAAVVRLQPQIVFGPKASNWIDYDIGFSIRINVGYVPEHKSMSQVRWQKNSEDRLCIEVDGLDAFNELGENWGDVKEGLEAILREKSVLHWVKTHEWEKLFNFFPLLRILLKSFT